MRGLWVVLALVAAGCRRETCESRVLADDAIDEDRVATLVDVFLAQVRPELGVCVPVLDVRRGSAVDAIDVDARTVALGSVAQADVHGVLGEALASQNDALLEGPPWATMSAPRVAFGQAAAAMAVQGALLTSTCPGDGAEVSTLRAAGEAFVPGDLLPGPDYFGVHAEPGRPVEVMRGEGSPVLAVSRNMLVLRTLTEVVDAVSLNGVVDELISPTGAIVTVPLIPRLLDEHEGISVLVSADGAWRRRVYRDANTVRLLGDGCVRPDEVTFEWSEELWSMWTEGADTVVVLWRFPR